MYPPGLRLPRIREAQGLTYRDVEKASYEIAIKRGWPDFVIHISRLADIQNRNVVPSLHKLYSCIWTLSRSRTGMKPLFTKLFAMPPLSLLRARTWARLYFPLSLRIHSRKVSHWRRPNYSLARPQQLWPCQR
jgi:hypothetical protein